MQAKDVTIPKSIGEVDATWLGHVLGAPLSDIKVTQIGQGVGIMGDIFRIELAYRTPGEELVPSVVVKLPSTFEENRAQGVALGMFEAEVRFYNELAPQIASGIPQVYLAAIDSGTADFVIVMQDLCNMSLVDQTLGMNARQASAAVKAIAGVHAVWWNRADSADLAWIPSIIGERVAFVDQLLVQILPVFKDAFAEFLPPGGVELYDAFAGNYLKINTSLADRAPWTIAHLDYRVDNMLFDGDDDVTIIDWQGIGRGPGVYDLAYVLGGSLTPEVRREHEKSLVQDYHRQLSDLGIRDYDLDALWNDYGHAQLMGGLATSMVIGGGMDLSNERGRRLVATMASRHAMAALDHDGMARLAKLD